MRPASCAGPPLPPWGCTPVYGRPQASPTSPATELTVPQAATIILPRWFLKGNYPALYISGSFPRRASVRHAPGISQNTRHSPRQDLHQLPHRCQPAKPGSEHPDRPVIHHPSPSFPKTGSQPSDTPPAEPYRNLISAIPAGAPGGVSRVPRTPLAGAYAFRRLLPGAILKRRPRCCRPCTARRLQASSALRRLQPGAILETTSPDAATAFNLAAPDAASFAAPTRAVLETASPMPQPLPAAPQSASAFHRLQPGAILETASPML